MNDSNIKRSNASFVAIGAFSPPQFYPAWLESEGLVRKGDAASARDSDTIISRDVSQFAISGIKFLILPDRLTITSSDERYSQPLKDIVISIFSILSRTPVTSFGVNHDYHFQTESGKLEKLMAALVPKNMGQEHLKSILLRGLDFQVENNFPSEEGSCTGVTLGRSREVLGMHIFINNHFEIKQKSPIEKTIYLVELVKNHWSEMEKKSKAIAGEIVGGSL